MSATVLKQIITKQIEHLQKEELEALERFITSLNRTKTPMKPQKPRNFGAMKGLVLYMAEDFDETPEDFKDYI
jgi:hypothetical protein